MNKPAIMSDPKILGGKPVITGTRIAVSAILDLLASGLSVDEVLKEYSGLTKDLVQEAISFAAQRLERETIQPIIQKDGTLTFPVV